jgi:hypothetical protein
MNREEPVSMEWVEVQVECYEGYRSRETPRRLITGDAVIEITDILDRWYEGGVRAGSVVLNYFKVKGGDGKTHLLRYNALFDRWAMAK